MSGGRAEFEVMVSCDPSPPTKAPTELQAKPPCYHSGPSLQRRGRGSLWLAPFSTGRRQSLLLATDNTCMKQQSEDNTTWSVFLARKVLPPPCPQG